MKLLHKLLGVSNYIEQLENKLFDKDQYYSNRLTEQKEINSNLNKERNELLATKTRLTAEVLKLREQLELEVHNSSKVIEVLLVVLRKELADSYDVLADKKIELSNLNSYTKKLENKINSIKQLVL